MERQKPEKITISFPLPRLTISKLLILIIFLLLMIGLAIYLAHLSFEIGQRSLAVNAWNAEWSIPDNGQTVV